MKIHFYARLPWLNVPRWMVRVESGTCQGFKWPISLLFPDAQFRLHVKPLRDDELNKP